MLNHRAKDLKIDSLLDAIREETKIINQASSQIVRLQSEIYKVRKHKEKLDKVYNQVQS
jgi:division protein CdvB (Snf7/Vps24/ESCRT-III family)